MTAKGKTTIKGKTTSTPKIGAVTRNTQNRKFATKYLWQVAPPIGAPRIFETPEILWQYACEYFDFCLKNPWKKQNWVGRDGKEVAENRPVPFTLIGFCVYLGIHETTLRNYGQNEAYSEFFGVYATIVQTIREQKFTGAANGFFNASIIGRDLGLVEKTDNEQRVSGSINFIFNEAAGCDPIKDLNELDSTNDNSKAD